MTYKRKKIGKNRHVSGYTKEDGTKVKSYMRSNQKRNKKRTVNRTK